MSPIESVDGLVIQRPHIWSMGDRGDVIPVIESGSTMSMKSCVDKTIVIRGMFK